MLKQDCILPNLFRAHFFFPAALGKHKLFWLGLDVKQVAGTRFRKVWVIGLLTTWDSINLPIINSKVTLL